MKDRRRSALFATLGILAIICVVAVAYLSKAPNAVPQVATQAPLTPAPIKVGQKAPDFTATTTAGAFSLDQVQGKPVLLEVFATWCPHCQRETAVLNALYDAYHDRVAFVAVSGSQTGMDGTTPESQGDVVRFVQQFNVRYPVAFDGDLAVAHLYFQSGYPTLVIIGKDHTIRYLNAGELPQADLQKQLDAALNA